MKKTFKNMFKNDIMEKRSELYVMQELWNRIRK